jgi:hypothetical protein
MQENSKVEWSNLGSLTASWLGLYSYDKHRRPEAHGQESEPSRCTKSL